MMLGMALFWGLVIVGIGWLLRETIGRGHHGPGSDPLAILDRRLAEGQISVDGVRATQEDPRSFLLTG